MQGNLGGSPSLSGESSLSEDSDVEADSGLCIVDIPDQPSAVFNKNLDNRALLLFECHPYVGADHVRMQLDMVLWTTLVGSELLTDVETMQTAVYALAHTNRGLGIKPLRGTHSLVRDLATLLARTSREWCYLKNSGVWRIMSKHQGIDWEGMAGAQEHAEMGQKFYSMLPDSPGEVCCSRCVDKPKTGCSFCSSNTKWLELPADEGVEFTLCMGGDANFAKPTCGFERQSVHALDRRSEGYRQLLIQFEALKEIAINAAEFEDDQSSLSRKNVHNAFDAIHKVLMHRPGTTYELPPKPSRFQLQTSERANPVDGHCVDIIEDSKRATPYLRITSHLLCRGDLKNIKDSKESSKLHQEHSAILQEPLETLQAKHTHFETVLQETREEMAKEGPAPKQAALVVAVAEKHGIPLRAAQRLYSETKRPAEVVEAAAAAPKLVGSSSAAQHHQDLDEIRAYFSFEEVVGDALLRESVLGTLLKPSPYPEGFSGETWLATTHMVANTAFAEMDPTVVEKRKENNWPIMLGGREIPVNDWTPGVPTAKEVKKAKEARDTCLRRIRNAKKDKESKKDNKRKKDKESKEGKKRKKGKESKKDKKHKKDKEFEEEFEEEVGEEAEESEESFGESSEEPVLVSKFTKPTGAWTFDESE